MSGFGALPSTFNRVVVTVHVKVGDRRYAVQEHVDAQYWAYEEMRESVIKTMKAKLAMDLIDRLDPQVDIRQS